MDFKIELVPLAVSDVDRARDFYAGLGWSVDFDQVVSPELRFVQVTPPGSGCSICFGVGLGMLPDGAHRMIQIVVEDADAALAYLRERDVECQGVEELAWGRFVTFADPDGNRWALQQLPDRSAG